MNKIYRIYTQSKALNFGGKKCVKHEFIVCPQNMVSPNVYVKIKRRKVNLMDMTKLALTLQFWDKHHKF